MRTANSAAWAKRKVVTESGCACSGFSNDHGFGAYCFPWEDVAQAPREASLPTLDSSICSVWSLPMSSLEDRRPDI